MPDFELDRFDKLMLNKCRNLLVRGEEFQGAIKLTPVGDGSLASDIVVVLTLLLNFLGACLYYLISQDYVKTADRHPVILFTSGRIILIWNSPSVSTVFQEIGSWDRKTYITADTFKIKFGSSTYKISRRSRKKLNRLNKAAIRHL
jgi:hypothetical protein